MKRELNLTINKGGNFLYVITLFAMMLILSLITLENNILNNIAPIFLWLCSTFVLQISMYSLFESDYHDGTLEQLVMGSYIPELVVFSKVFVHWLIIGIPIGIISVLVNIVLLNNGIVLSLFLGFAVITSLLVIIFISAAGYALVMGNSGACLIAQILTLPLMIPVLIYFNILYESLQNNIYSNDLWLLGILVFCLIPINIFAATYSIKLSIEQD